MVDFIETYICEEISIEEMANIAALSPFYFQRLFTRLVKKPAREYIKLRRLACVATSLKNSEKPIIDIAIEYGFGSRETLSRAFKQTYGIPPSEYRRHPVALNHFDKPNLLLNYAMVDEGVPLVTEGIVLEYDRKNLKNPVHFLGVESLWQFEQGKMLGERPGVSQPALVWDKFFEVAHDIPGISGGWQIGVSYIGDAPSGYGTYFVGKQAMSQNTPSNCTKFVSWTLPAREYIVCNYEAENLEELKANLGKMMKFTRFWLKNHGLKAGDFFPEIYPKNTKKDRPVSMQMWIPFNER